MQDRPTIYELLRSVERFLRDDVVPATDGRRQFLARVAANAIGLVERELQGEAEHGAREWAGLDALLGPAEAMPGDRDGLAAAVRARNEALCARIRAGDYDAASTARTELLVHVRAIVRDKLLVTNRAYLEADGDLG
jgi:hypothetical protein